jgi:hypothetical protein
MGTAAGVRRFGRRTGCSRRLSVEVSGTQVTTYTQQFDVENRLTAVTQAGGSPQVAGPCTRTLRHLTESPTPSMMHFR